MRLLLDSCISFFAVRELRGAGLDVSWIPETGKDPGDDAIIKRAVDEDLTLVTADKDFGELVFVFERAHPAIIRLVDIPARDQGRILLRLIEAHKDDIEKKALITVDRYRVRVRIIKEE